LNEAALRQTLSRAKDLALSRRAKQGAARFRQRAAAPTYADHEFQLRAIKVIKVIQVLLAEQSPKIRFRRRIVKVAPRCEKPFDLPIHDWKEIRPPGAKAPRLPFQLQLR